MKDIVIILPHGEKIYIRGKSIFIAENGILTVTNEAGDVVAQANSWLGWSVSDPA